jgi:hypothetical protein
MADAPIGEPDVSVQFESVSESVEAFISFSTHSTVVTKQGGIHWGSSSRFTVLYCLTFLQMTTSKQAFIILVVGHFGPDTGHKRSKNQKNRSEQLHGGSDKAILCK